MNIYAKTTDLDPIGGEGLGPFAQKPYGSPGSGLEAITGVVSSIIGIMTIAAAVWFIFQFLVGGLNWITSGGDKQKLHEARDRLTHAFIGLIIVIAGWSILALAGQFFGYDILITDPEEVIKQIGP